jgi:hypothetical protein
VSKLSTSLHIGIFAQNGQFDVLGKWALSLEKAFLSLGHTTCLLSCDDNQILSGQFQSQKFDFTIGFNIPPRFLIEEELFFEALRIPHVAFFVDHPFDNYFGFQLRKRPQFLLVSTVCSSYYQDLIEVIGHQDSLSRVLYHAMEEDGFETCEKRKNKAVIGGSFLPPEEIVELAERSLSSCQLSLFFILSEEIEENKFKISCSQALKEKLHELGPFNKKDYIIIRGFLEPYIRRRKRQVFLKAFGQLCVDCYGPIPSKEVKELAPAWSWLGEVKTTELNKKISSYQIMLNVQSDTLKGSHERVLRGLVGECNVITEYSELYKSFNLSDVRFWDGSSCKEDAKRLFEESLKNFPCSYKQGYLRKKVLKKFTWNYRAQELIEFVQKSPSFLAKNLGYSNVL